MAVFPLPTRPKASYKTGGRKFAAPRGSRKHAACDLVAPDGTPVYAVDHGTVVRGPYHFHHGADALEVDHRTYLVRYCEIRAAKGVRPGKRVHKGKVIGYIKKMKKDTMLHFEMYEKKARGRLSVRSNKPFERRSDLVDPTSFLDGLVLKKNEEVDHGADNMETRSYY